MKAAIQMIAEVENALNLILTDRHALLKHRAAVIIMAVCSQFEITFAGLQGKRRPMRLALPRQAAMYCLRKRTGLSLQEIGDIFRRDHGTVIHAMKAVENRRTVEPEFSETFDAVWRQVCEPEQVQKLDVSK